MELSVQRCSAVTTIPPAALNAGCRSVKLPALAATSCLAFPCSTTLNFPSAALRRRHFTWACSRVDSAGTDVEVMNKVVHFSDVFWKFLRPYTIRGTIIASLSLFTRVLMENPSPITWSLLLTSLSGLIALICANGYIVGINQIYDVAIDKVNKPYLPMAAGDLSEGSAWVLVSSMAAVGFAIVAWVNSCGPFLTSLYCLSFFLGFIYSVPPFRLKRFPVVAFLIISTFRGFLINYGVYYAMRATLGLTFEWSFPVAFITSFITLFALVIAITKDLPDVEGDREFKIDTFASKLGVRNIALFGSGLLLMNYIGAIVLANFLPQVFKKSFMITSHATLALALLFRVWILEKANYTKEALASFYQFIWILLYAEYAVFPFI